jgi:hypothetical protein
MMPSVVLLEAAWFLVYTSGSLIIPKVETKDKKVPRIIKIIAINLKVSFTFNQLSFLKELGKCNGPDKGQDSEQENDIEISACVQNDRG